jgi:hypothetical protein
MKVNRTPDAFTLSSQVCTSLSIFVVWMALEIDLATLLKTYLK